MSSYSSLLRSGLTAASLARAAYRTGSSFLGSSKSAKRRARRRRTARVPRSMPAIGMPELKSVDLPSTTINYTTTTATTGTPLCMLQVGTGVSNRIGRKARLHSLHFHGFTSCLIVPGNAVTQEILRVLIVYDKQTNGASATFADVVQSVTQAAATSSSAIDGMNLNNRDRFEILRDKYFYMPGRAANGAGYNFNDQFVVCSPETSLTTFSKLSERDQVYKADSSPAVITDIATGNIFVVVQGTVGSQYALTFSSRVRFYD